MPIIRTPDQRLRVFISSTIQELAEERRGAREAVAGLRLTPVFFDAGARPHPPRDLYSAYLEQSHVFLGIYWRSYGWIAPGADISGLEDEFRLSAGKPRLIYVKRGDDREPRLAELVAEIERVGTTCYQLFTDAAELRARSPSSARPARKLRAQRTSPWPSRRKSLPPRQTTPPRVDRDAREAGR